MLRRSLFGLTLALVPVLGLFATQAAAQSPRDFVDAMTQEVVSVANDASLGEAAALERLRTLLRDRFAVTTMGAFAIANRWPTMTNDEKLAYIQAYERYLMGQYARRFGSLEGATFQVTGSVPLGRDTGVNAAITLPGGDQYTLRFRVRAMNSGLRILDAEVSGTSFLVTQRDEFQGLLGRTGGDINALIAAMDRISGN